MVYMKMTISMDLDVLYIHQGTIMKGIGFKIKEKGKVPCRIRINHSLSVNSKTI
jgi:hypothetical protein